MSPVLALLIHKLNKPHIFNCNTCIGNNKIRCHVTHCSQLSQVIRAGRQYEQRLLSQRTVRCLMIELLRIVEMGHFGDRTYGHELVKSIITKRGKRLFSVPAWCTILIASCGIDSWPLAINSISNIDFQCHHLGIQDNCLQFALNILQAHACSL